MSDDAEILIVAGEASGDLHAARLLSELRRLRPELSAFGLGGDELQAAGLDSIAHSREISVVGITEVLKILGRARELFRRLLEECERRRPRLAVLVDFPDFNLRLARQLDRRGIPVVYYISPQLWAWRRGRVKTVARHVARMLVLFPFEVDFYRRFGVDAIHVGHPLVDEVPELPNVADGGELDASSPVRLALLPGSRDSEIEALLPTMIAAAGALAEELGIEVSVILAPTVDRARVQEIVDAAGIPVAIVDRERFRAVSGSHLALCASGTATLEVGLLGTPMIVVYRVGAMTYRLARRLIRVPHISLVNLVLEERVVPELVQEEASPARVKEEALALLRDPARLAATRSRLGELRERLGEGGASRRAAAEVDRLLADLPGQPGGERR